MTIDLWARSIAVIRSGQAPSGAYVASPNFKTYAYSWLRDGAFIAYGMDRSGQHDSARAFHQWVDRTLRSVAHKVDLLEGKGERGGTSTSRSGCTAAIRWKAAKLRRPGATSS